jgi:hypothetical protein
MHSKNNHLHVSEIYIKKNTINSIFNTQLFYNTNIVVSTNHLIVD